MSEVESRPAQADAAEVTALLSELSELLLSWSWEGVIGYEGMVERVGQTYGFPDTTVIMEAQAALIRLEADGHSIFVKGGIPGFPPMAYTQDIKVLLDDIYDGRLSATEARQTLRGIHDRKSPYSPFLNWLGVVVIGVAFAVDLVGTWEGMFWAAITGMATGLVFITQDRVAGLGKIAPLIATLASGIIVMLAWKFGWTAAAPGLLLISATFVYVPGDSISTQAYELAMGRWSAGVDRLFYSIIMLVLQVTGAYLAILLTGVALVELFPTASTDTFAWWAAYPGHFLFVIGILLTFNMSWAHFPRAVVTLWIVTAVAQLATMAYGEAGGTFLATIVGTVLSVWQARKPRSIPAFVLMIPVIFALSPGSHGLRQLETWISGETITGINNLESLATVLLAIAMGIVVGRVIAHPWDWLAVRAKS